MNPYGPPGYNSAYGTSPTGQQSQGYGAPSPGYQSGPSGYGGQGGYPGPAASGGYPPQTSPGYPPSNASAPPAASGFPQYTAQNMPPPPPGADPKVWSWFVGADRNGTRNLDVEELHYALKSSPEWPAVDQDVARMIMNLFDVQQRGEIDFNVFQAIVKYIRDWLGIFQRFDKDRSGSIDQMELRQALQAFGYNLGENVMRVIVKKYDHTKSGNIAFDDFLACCVTVRSLTTKFQGYDRMRNGTATLAYDQFLEIVFSSI